MELDDLKGAWANAGQTTGGASLDELITRLRRVRRKGFRGAAREIAGAAVFFPLFAWFGWLLATHGGPLVSIIGIGLALVGFLLIVAVLVWARRPREYLGASMVEHLRTELAHLDRRIFILQHTAWWGFAPVGVGANLFFAGVNVARPLLVIGYVLFTLAVCGFMVWANRRAAHGLRPLRDSLLRGLEAVRESQTKR
jgi:hypothetical protein